MKQFLEVLIILIGSANLLLACRAIIRLRQPTTLTLWGLKVMASGISPFFLLTGVVVALLGALLNSIFAIVIGAFSAVLSLFHIIQISRPPAAYSDFENAFGKEWKKQISDELKNSMLANRYVLLLRDIHEPVFKQNIPFYAQPGTDRKLLCDTWEPPKNIVASGLTFIYLHGGAWAVLDKDFGSRPFFTHLANQGHVIMDVAYRLFPEADMMGMVHDAKQAIAWMRKHAAEYKVDPDKIVIGGGSSGAHIALLAAYTKQNEIFIPPDLHEVGPRVAGVISFYGQANLKTTYYHTCQHLSKSSALAGKKDGESGGMPEWIQKRMSKNFHRLGFDKNVDPGMLDPMLGGSPEEKPEAYALFSPINYIDKSCPPTLILHGKQDILAPVTAIQQMHSSLTEAKVPVVMHLFSQTDHAFDLIFPKYSPSAQNAFYDVDRFLGFIAGSRKVQMETEKVSEHLELVITS